MSLDVILPTDKTSRISHPLLKSNENANQLQGEIPVDMTN